MEVRQNIQALRERMAQEKVAALIVPSEDPHMSEYPPERFKARRFISGFTGSAGAAVILKDMWGLWTDGRYYIQAKRQIDPAGGVLFKAVEPDCPSIPAFLAEKLQKGQQVAISGQVCSRAYARKLEEELSPKGVTVRYDLQPAEEIWADRPPLAPAKMWMIPDEVSGLTAKEKIAAVRRELKKAGADALLTARLDSTAWLFNVRAEDVAFVPVPVAWSLLTPAGAFLFTEVKRVGPDVQAMLRENGVALLPYEDVTKALKEAAPMQLLLEENEINMALWTAAKSNPRILVVEGVNPIPALKTVKTEAELKNLAKAQLLDCAALAEFFAELESRMNKGEKLNEYEAAQLLESFRQRQAGYAGSSFAPILAYGPNAAMMHYGPTAEASSVIEPKGFLLVDTGGHYAGDSVYGTTDITRTYAMGPLTPGEREDYTTVAQAFMGLHRAVFKTGTLGKEVDDFSRIHLARRLLDYRCGTGHGVGFLLNIHEGPSGFGAGARENPLKAGAYVTIEPGIYTEGQWGIRIENDVAVTFYGESEYGSFLYFKPMTFMPIDPEPLCAEKLEKGEIAWLNDYNRQVRELLCPLLSPQALSWVTKRTRAIR